MALYPWRFQADLARGETDPLVTLFVGPERYVMDDNGDPTADTFVEHDARDPVLVPLSELPAVLASPDQLTQMRKDAKKKTDVS